MRARTWLVGGAAMIVVIAVVLVGRKLYDHRPVVGSAPHLTAPTSGLVARGEYLTAAADCVACHTSERDKPFSGGRAFKLPFGTMYSPNITPDRETGIGTWSDADFLSALHRGVGKDGKHYYPSFPYASYTALTDEDALAIKAYLFTLAPVHAPPRPNDFPFPFNQRWGISAWNALFLHDRRFEPRRDLSVQQNRGYYLATALGHCGECHTPRNLAYALKSDEPLAGTQLEGWDAWNLTSDKTSGIGAWSDEALFDYLSTGHASGHGSAGGPMAEAVEASLQKLQPEDTRSLIAYLRTVPPQQRDTERAVIAAPAMIASSAFAPSADDSTPELGRHLFEGSCASCHQWNGSGQETPFADLAGSQAVSDPSGLNVMQTVLKGARMRTRLGEAYMPDFGAALTDEEVAAVTNYVIAHFGGKPGRVTGRDVSKARKAG